MNITESKIKALISGKWQGIPDDMLDSEDAVAYLARKFDVLQQQVNALAALAEERREFIVNGAEMGCIQLPVFDDDPATATYQRCLLNPKFAADAVIREIGAKAVEGFGDELGLGSNNMYLLMKKCAYDHADKIRSGEQP